MLMSNPVARAARSPLHGERLSRADARRTMSSARSAARKRRSSDCATGAVPAQEPYASAALAMQAMRGRWDSPPGFPPRSSASRCWAVPSSSAAPRRRGFRGSGGAYPAGPRCRGSSAFQGQLIQGGAVIGTAPKGTSLLTLDGDRRRLRPIAVS